MKTIVLSFIAFCGFTLTSAAQTTIELNSGRIGVTGLTLPEAEKPVTRIALAGKVNGKGEGSGTLILDMTESPKYDEFGFVTAHAPTREIKLDCELTFWKKTTRTYASRRLGAPESEVREHKEEWSLYTITGTKLKSKINLAIKPNGYGFDGRLLILGDDGKVKHVIDVRSPPPQEPCHPGCFPAGTPVRIPGGTTTIERLREGDTVTTVSKEGKLTTAKVTGVFITKNSLLELRTADVTLITTKTQPIALEAGGYKAAGELKKGDRIWRWQGNERKAVAVESISSALRDAEVFNLILGDPTTFIAGDFLVRSKPPGVVGDPVP
jgi:hypothetical protein